ncbi:fluoride efflux transporter FluC [Propionibacteriaceae bacterium Y1923]
MSSAPDTSAPATRPAYLRPAMVGLVAAGGMVGTLARAALGQALPHEPATWPWLTLIVNLVGAFVLAVLLESLGRLRRGSVPLRLALGTGVLGGFTTYSAFAVETRDLLAGGQVWLALAYVLASLLGGQLIAMLGLRVAR